MAPTRRLDETIDPASVTLTRTNLQPPSHALASALDSGNITSIAPRGTATFDVLAAFLGASAADHPIDLRSLPFDIAQGILEQRWQSTKEFMESWSESIRKNAAADRDAEKRVELESRSGLRPGTTAENVAMWKRVLAELKEEDPSFDISFSAKVDIAAANIAARRSEHDAARGASTASAVPSAAASAVGTARGAAVDTLSIVDSDQAIGPGSDTRGGIYAADSAPSAPRPPPPSDQQVIGVRTRHT